MRMSKAVSWAIITDRTMAVIPIYRKKSKGK